MNEAATIHTDGACSGNPEPGGFAAIIEVGECRFTVTGGEPNTTNNRMEMSAVIEAVRRLNSQSDLRHSHLTVRSDSQYIVNAFNENWIENWKRKGWRTAKKQPVANKDLWEALLRELSPHPTKFVWVKGHSGDPMNEECDRLAVEQAKIAPSQPGYWTSAGNPLTAAIQTQDTLKPKADHQPEPLPDLELLIDQTADAIEDAITSMRRGQSWKTADTLELALQRLDLHRKLRAQQATDSPSDLPL